MSQLNDAERETVLEHSGKWVLDHIDALESQLAAERAKVALATKHLKIAYDSLDVTTGDKVDRSALAALQSSDALAEIRREVARECAEIAQKVIQNIDDAEFACDIYGPVQRAIRAKFGVTA